MVVHGIRIISHRVSPIIQFDLTHHRGLKRNPSVGADSISLMLNDRRWLEIMGEIHYSRVEPSQWKHALAKTKAGEISIISSYIFWIHHEEPEGCFDWMGRQALHAA